VLVVLINKQYKGLIIMNEHKTWYIAKTSEGFERVWITLDLSPFLIDGISESQAIEQALEIFERNCDNFNSW
jgi:hypothetical protein